MMYDDKKAPPEPAPEKQAQTDAPSRQPQQPQDESHRIRDWASI